MILFRDERETKGSEVSAERGRRGSLTRPLAHCDHVRPRVDHGDPDGKSLARSVRELDPSFGKRGSDDGLDSVGFGLRVERERRVSRASKTLAQLGERKAHLVSNVLVLELPLGRHDGRSRDSHVVRVPGLDGEVASVDVVGKTAVDGVLGEGSVGDDDLSGVVEEVLVLSRADDVAAGRKARVSETLSGKRRERNEQVGRSDVLKARVT